MRTKMLILAFGAAFVAVFFYFLNVPDWRLIIVMVAATTAYQLAVRLAIGFFLFRAVKINNYDNAWFKQKKWERKFYELIKVRVWKNMFPSYAPEKFDIKNGFEGVIVSTCKAEIAHFILIFLSFVPTAVIFLIGSSVSDIIVIAATSLIASLVDLAFLFVQRYNRPRLIAAMKRQSSTTMDSITTGSTGTSS